jgi:hypothetical protein
MGKVWADQAYLLRLLLISLQQLVPGFWTTHPEALQCLVPAMQLALLSVRHVSRALQQSGLQEPQLDSWMDNLLQETSGVASTALATTAHLYQEAVEAATGSTESSLHTGSSTLTGLGRAGNAAANSSSSSSDRFAEVLQATFGAEPTRGPV